MVSHTFVHVYFLGQFIVYEGSFQRHVPQNHAVIQSFNKHLLSSCHGGRLLVLLSVQDIQQSTG